MNLKSIAAWSVLMLLWCLPLVSAEIICDTPHPGLEVAKKLLEKELERYPGKVHLAIDPKLAADECKVSQQGMTTVCYGGSPRGTVYGAMRVVRSTAAKMDPADGLAGHPRWRNAFFCDQVGYLFPAEKLGHLIKNEVRGFVWNFSAFDWKSLADPECKLRPEHPTVGEQLAMIREQSALGLIDYALMIRIANNKTQPSLNCASDAEIDAFINVLRIAAQNGVKHILVCADDHTKYRDDRYVCTFPEEVERFGDSVGRAHGYLCKRIFEALKPEFPELELTFCPAPYSLIDHNAENSVNRAYFKDWEELAPMDFRVIWTGPKIIPEMPMTGEHFKRFNALVPKHKLMYFDNSECIDHPFSAWMARLYPEAAQDHDGFMLENNHSVSWPDMMPFLLSGAEYLQRLPADADFETEHYVLAASALYGKEGAKLVLKVSRLIGEYRKLNTFFITRQPEILTELETLSKALKERNISTWRLNGWIERMKQSVNSPRPDIDVPRIDASLVSGTEPGKAFFTAAKKVVSLQNDGTLSNFGEFYFAHDGKNLYVAFRGPVLEKITPEKASGNGFGTCYDYVLLKIADAKAGPLELRANVVGESKGEAWPFQASRDEKDCRIFFAIPLDTLRQSGLTEFAKDGKLALSAARVTHTVNHYGINTQRNPANIVLKDF